MQKVPHSSTVAKELARTCASSSSLLSRGRKARCRDKKGDPGSRCSFEARLLWKPEAGFSNETRKGDGITSRAIPSISSWYSSLSACSGAACTASDMLAPSGGDQCGGALGVVCLAARVCESRGWIAVKVLCSTHPHSLVGTAVQQAGLDGHWEEHSP